MIDPAWRVKRSRQMSGRVNRVPRAIATRGTENGYYEMPDHALIRLYGNTSTGLWDTNQTSGAPTGATGYQGFGFCSDIGLCQVNLGVGSTSATVFKDFTDYNLKCAMFDMVKIHSIEVEFWVTNEPSTLSSSNVYSAPELWIAKDLTDATPPASGEDMFPYSDCTRVVLDPTKTFKMSFKPYIKTEASTTATDTGTSYTPGISQPSTYLNTSVLPIKHFGFKGWVFCPTTMASQTYSINMKVRRICRWKSLK